MKDTIQDKQDILETKGTKQGYSRQKRQKTPHFSVVFSPMRA